MDRCCGDDRSEGAASIQEMILKQGNLYVPDDRSILVSLDSCLYGVLTHSNSHFYIYILRQ